MKRFSQCLAALSMGILSLGAALPVLAQPGVLETQEAQSRINVRSQPETSSKIEHYGVSGDRVEVLEVTKGDDRYFWFYVRFNRSGAEGWIRSDLVDLVEFPAD